MNYVTYTRNNSGIVTRAHDRIKLAKADRVAQFPHPEKLLGWAERTVYWSRDTGPATGVAPIVR